MLYLTENNRLYINIWYAYLQIKAVPDNRGGEAWGIYEVFEGKIGFEEM